MSDFLKLIDPAGKPFYVRISSIEIICESDDAGPGGSKFFLFGRDEPGFTQQSASEVVRFIVEAEATL